MIFRLKAIGLLLLTCAACGRTMDVTSQASYSINTAIKRPSEQPLLDIAMQSSVFSGYYCANGDLIVGTTASVDDPASVSLAGLVQTSGVAFYCRNSSVPDHVPDIVLAEQRYSFMALRAWRDSFENTFFATAGTHSIGIDYEKNQIVMGVEPGREAAVSSAMEALGLPADALSAEATGAAHLNGVACPSSIDGPDLQNCFRPIPAGVAIGIWPNGGGGDATDGCTIGAAAPLWVAGYGAYEQGFVTNSHCVPPFNVQDSEWVSQPGSDPTDGINQFVGVEFEDAPAPTCPFPLQMYKCKNSDSAWIWKVNGTMDNGTIAQTLSWSGADKCCYNGCAACWISPSTPRFHIYDSAVPMQGMQVEKMGQTSGWTRGTVTQTCIDYLDDGYGNLYVCNAASSNQSFHGDSGSPMFYWWYWSTDPNTVELVGLLWGGPADNSTYFSPWANVVEDLGTLDIRDHAVWP